MRPETRLRSVVLPAPFGPMSPCTSPAATPSEAPSTAASPPKVRRTPCRLKQHGAPSARPQPGPYPRRERGDALGQEEDDEEEDRPVHEEAKRAGGEPDAGGDLPEHLRQRGEEGGAHHRPVEEAGAAHHGVDEHVDHAGEGVGARRDHEGVVRLEGAGDAGEGGAERQHGELVARGVDAHGAGGRLVLADGLDGVADPRSLDAPEDEEGEPERRVDHPDGGALGDRGEPEGAVREVEVHEEEAHHLAEADGGDGQEDPLEPQHGQPEGDGHERRHAARRPRARPRRGARSGRSGWPTRRRRWP